MRFNFNETFDFMKKLKSILIIGLLTLLATQAHAFGTNGTTAGAPVPQTSHFTGNGAGTLGNGVTCEIWIQVADVLSTTSGNTAFTFVRFFGPNSFYGGQAAGGYYYSPDLNSGSWNNLNNSLAANKSAIETACGWTAGSMNVISEVSSGTTFSNETELSTTFQFAYGGGLYQYTGGLSSGSASARATISNALTYVGPYIPAVAPGAPTIGSATSGNTLATVNFTAPASDGGASITSYTATCTSSNGGTTGTASGSASPITVTGLTNGKNYSCTVTATNSAGTGSASLASNSVTPMGTQTITFANPGAQNFGTTPTLGAISTSGLVVSFTSSTTGVCTISSGGTLTFLTIGTCTVNADQTGNSSYLAASTVSHSFTVNAVVPNAPAIGSSTTGNARSTVTFTAPAFVGGASITSYTATCTSSNGGTTGTASGSASPITVTGLTNGKNYSCTVTATNSAGTGSASSSSNTVTPMGTQTITFANPGAQNFGTTPTLSATSTSGLVVSFTSSTTGVCTISSGGTLTFLTIGTCTVNADQAGNSSYLAASTVSQSFTVNAVVPNAPTNVSIKVDVGQAMVMFTTPASDGGVPISGYTATCTSSNGGTIGTASGSTSPIIVTGLNIGQNYTCTVTSTNNVGTGPASLPSVSMTIPHTVPTLSEWAMMFLASLVAMFAIRRMRRQ